MTLLRELLEMAGVKKQRNFVAKNMKGSGAGPHEEKKGKHAPRHKQKEETRKQVKRGLDEGTNYTQLSVDQMRELVSYMRELIEKGFANSPEDAAGLALEDVAGFETADERKIQSTISRLAHMYLKAYS